MLTYEYLNDRYRRRVPRSKNFFSLRPYERISYNAATDSFFWESVRIRIHRDNSYTLTEMDNRIKSWFSNAYAARFAEATGLAIWRPRDNRLHALETRLGLITGDCTITADGKLISPAPLQRWEDDKEKIKKWREERKLIEAAAQISSIEPSRQWWWQVDSKRELIDPNTPMTRRVELWKSHYGKVKNIPGRGKYENTQLGFWVLRPVSSANPSA